MFKKALASMGLVLSLALTAAAQGPAILDRIVATVNGSPILQSDWEEAVRYEAFIAGHPLDQVTGGERKAALDRLIDQELLREQMQASDFPQATEDEIRQRVEQVRKQYPGAETDSGWQSILAEYNLTESELRGRIALQLNLMRLVDARLRPNVSIDNKSIESYYSQELLPQLRQQGAKEVPLADVTPKIKELLTQRKVSELLTAWLQNLRAGSEIHTMLPQPAPGDQAQ
ncbi:MAG TPA: SurA N-terminal domain-containing protein [Terriglobales bacterium]|nr:SurA N-terminal domain-containing protein [Terriglobales bacterium]